MEEGPSVAKEGGAFVSTAGEGSVARESETFVTEEKCRDSEVARDGIPVSLEPGTSVTLGGESCAFSGFLSGSVWQGQALVLQTGPRPAARIPLGYASHKLLCSGCAPLVL